MNAVKSKEVDGDGVSWVLVLACLVVALLRFVAFDVGFVPRSSKI